MVGCEKGSFCYKMKISKHLLQRCIILGMVLLVCTNANAVDLTGVWTGKGLNTTHTVETDIEVTLSQKGRDITGMLKVSKPLYGSGPLKGWVDIEKREFWATIKCNQLIVKILMGGATIYLESCSLDIKEDLRTGQLVGEIKGDFRYDFGWARDQIGTFRITRTMQEGFGDTGTVEENTAPVYTTEHSNVYHKSNCPKLGTGDFIEFASSQQARNAGGVPCNYCNP